MPRRTSTVGALLLLACGTGGDATDGGSPTGLTDTTAIASSSGGDPSGTSSLGDDTTTTASATATDGSDHGDSSGTTGDDSPVGWTPELVDRALLCKLISDEALDDPTANQTHTRFNLRGTDLGVPVISGDRLYLFFGDTVGYRVIWDFGEDPDAVAYVDLAAARADPSALCDGLSFLVTPDVPSVAAGVDPAIERDFAGAAMAAPRGESLADYIAQPAAPAFPFMPGTFEVPAGALARDDGVWLFYAGMAELSPRPRATIGYLAQWQPGPLPGYQIVRRVDALVGGALGGHFIQVAPIEQDGAVFMLGTGDYRRSGVYLARSGSAGLGDGGDTELFDPTTATWRLASGMTQQEREATLPIFESDGVGELGVQWVEAAGVYVAMYQRELHDGNGAIVDNRIVLRTAATLTGPWSDALTIVDMADPAFTAAHCCGATCIGEQLLHCLIAGLYGAYPLPLVEAVADGDGYVLDVPFVVSTWDPYNVALMRTHIRITPA